MGTRTKPWARWIGFFVGCGLAAAFLLNGRMPQHHGTLGARVTMLSDGSGEETVSPSGRFLAARDLRPGVPAKGVRGKLILRNPTVLPLSVRLRGSSSSPDLDRLLRLEIAAGPKRLFRGGLRELRRRGGGRIRLGRRERRRIDVRVWLPKTGIRGYEARAIEVALDWRAKTVKG